jgi:hypothetical protein
VRPAGPKQLVRDVALAEVAGFDFAVKSEHYFRWLEAPKFILRSHGACAVLVIKDGKIMKDLRA